MRFFAFVFLLSCGKTSLRDHPLMDKIIAVEEESFLQGQSIALCHNEIIDLQADVAELRADQELLRRKNKLIVEQLVMVRTRLDALEP